MYFSQTDMLNDMRPWQIKAKRYIRANWINGITLAAFSFFLAGAFFYSATTQIFH